MAPLGVGRWVPTAEEDSLSECTRERRKCLRVCLPPESANRTTPACYPATRTIIYVLLREEGNIVHRIHQEQFSSQSIRTRRTDRSTVQDTLHRQDRSDESKCAIESEPMGSYCGETCLDSNEQSSHQCGDLAGQRVCVCPRWRLVDFTVDPPHCAQ